MFIKETFELEEMAKLDFKYAAKSLGDFGKYIYFSKKNSTHGPRIKFYGGNIETSQTKDSPTMSFDVNGNCKLELASWMNKKNCPNAYDKKYTSKVEDFINANLPLLLLVWFYKLDEADCLKYFEGALKLKDLLEMTYRIPEDIKEQMLKIKTLGKLHNFCIENNLYEE